MFISQKIYSDYKINTNFVVPEMNVFPYKIFAEISPRLPRSRRDYQDLAEMTKISPRSRQDFSKILPRLLRSRRDSRDLGEITKISPR